MNLEILRNVYKKKKKVRNLYDTSYIKMIYSWNIDDNDTSETTPEQNRTD